MRFSNSFRLIIRRCVCLFLALLMPAQVAGSLRSLQAANDPPSIASFPVFLAWRISLAPFAMELDRQPTQEEYLGVADATTRWLSTILPNISSLTESYPGVDVSSVTCSLAADRTRYDSEATRYQHTVGVACSVGFEKTQDSATLPSSFKSVASGVKYSELQDFLYNYLRPSGPEDSMFLYSGQEITYWLQETAPIESEEPPIPPTVAILENPTNYRASGMTQSISDTSKFAHAFAIPVTLTWTLTGLLNRESRQATPEEYQEVVQATQDWIVENAERYYNEESVSDDFSLFHIETALGETAPIFDEESSGRPRYSIPVTVTFMMRADAKQDLPRVAYDITKTYDLSSFTNNHLRLTKGIFSDMSGVRYGGSTGNIQMVDANDVTTRTEQNEQGYALIDNESCLCAVTLFYDSIPSTSNNQQQPTPEELDGIVDATRDYLDTSLRENYELYPNSDEFVGVSIDLNEHESLYTTGSTRHVLNIRIEMWYGGGLSQPSGHYLTLIKNILDDSTKYKDTYVDAVRPEDSVFRSTREFSWTFGHV